MTKLGYTSKTAIIMSFLVMNLERWLKAIFLPLFRALNLLLKTPFPSVFVYMLTEEGAIVLTFRPAFMTVL
jgi:hypothetical protein